MYTKATGYFVIGLLFLGLASASSAAGGKIDPEALASLAFEKKDDGKCHILSEGGKLMVMHNHHENKAVSFRLIRYFASVRQQGRATGTIEPGNGPIKLGCTQVDGREQHWEVERASFAE